MAGVDLSGSFTEIITKNFLLGVALLTFACNVVLYFLALRSLPLAFAYPIMTIMSFFIINGYAVLFLKEPITTLQLVGYAMVLGGVTLISLCGAK